MRQSYNCFYYNKQICVHFKWVMQQILNAYIIINETYTASEKCNKTVIKFYCFSTLQSREARLWICLHCMRKKWRNNAVYTASVQKCDKTKVDNC